MTIHKSPFVSGQYCAAGTEPLHVVDPATGTVLAEVESADTQALEMAVQAASLAQREWAKTSYRHRAEVMLNIAATIGSHKEELARLVTQEVGKPIREAEGEIDATTGFFSYFAHLVVGSRGEITPLDAGEEIWTKKIPRGIVAAIIPWNYPAALTARKSAPAIAAGNAIIIKPHEQTPLSALRVAELMVQAGLPSGLISVLPGRGDLIGAELIRHPRIDFVTMTGSLRAGRAILTAAADRVLPVSLELGGKAPLIVFDDANLAEAARLAAFSRFANNGQVCICAERIFVHRSVFDAFLDAFIAETRKLKIGNPLDHDTDLGPKITRGELDKVLSMVQRAQADGARVLYQGKVPSGDEFSRGWWLAPVVLGDLTDDMEIMRAEVFGPVAPITVFDTEVEVIERANNSDYGLSAYVFTNDHSRIMRVTAQLQAGEVYVNRVGPEDYAGYHAGMKLSGLGGDDGPHGLDAYWQKKTIYVRWDS